MTCGPISPLKEPFKGKLGADGNPLESISSYKYQNCFCGHTSWSLTAPSLDIDVEVDLDIDRSFDCLEGASKSVQVLQVLFLDDPLTE